MKIKNNVRKFLVKVKLWNFVSILMLLPEVLSWKRRGFSGVAPHPIKMMIIKS